MKIFELLSGSTTPLDNNQAGGGSFATPQMDAMSGSSQPQQQPQQQANMLTDFFTTPHPIGTPTQPAAPAPQPAGTPPAQASGMVPRPFGNSAVGQGLDAINTGLQTK